MAHGVQSIFAGEISNYKVSLLGIACMVLSIVPSCVLLIGVT